MGTKSKLVIIACLFGLLVLACDDKGTDPPPVDFKYKRATINAFVHDQNDLGITGATIVAAFFLEQINYQRYLLIDTDPGGTCEIKLGVRDQAGKDTVVIYATMWGENIYSDTARLYVGHDGQVFNVELTLSDQNSKN